MEEFSAKYLRDPIQARAAREFLANNGNLPRIHVGKSRISVPIDKVQMVLRSGFWRLLTEDGSETSQNHILDAFDIRGLHEDPVFLQAWLIANGILELEHATLTENIYCDYLMINGYVPPVGEGKGTTAPRFYCESGQLVCKGVVTNSRILEAARNYPEFLEELILENTPEILKNVKKGWYFCAEDHKYAHSHIIWHESLGEKNPPKAKDFFDSDRAKSLTFGGSDGTEDVYIGDAWYEPNNEELAEYHAFNWIMSKNPRFCKTRAVGFFVLNGGDQGCDVYYLLGEGSNPEVVAFYV